MIPFGDKNTSKYLGPCVLFSRSSLPALPKLKQLFIFSSMSVCALHCGKSAAAAVSQEHVMN